LGLVLFAVVLIGASAASFAGQASKGGVDRDLLGTHALGKPGQSVRAGVYAKLTADPGGPYTVRRGGKVELDGSASRPKKKITSYLWTFTSHCPGGVQGKASSLSGKTVKIVAVCRTTATLTVSGGGATSKPKSTTIRVTGKLRDVDFHQPPDADTGNFPFDTAQGTFVFGFNRCAIEWAHSHDPDLADHWLHKPADGNDVETDKVHDPGGPYNGFYYVTDHNLKVVRQLIINRKLLPGGDVYELNKAKHKKAIENIDEATLDHERIHGELVKKALRSKKLKFLDKLARAVDLSEEALQNRADAIIVGGETELKDASTESKVHKEMADIWGHKEATILRPTDNSRKTYVLAKIGDIEAGTG
jgi:hypothetical protein